MNDHYILDADHKTVPVDLMTWARWFENNKTRRVALTRVSKQCDVSTVFLGLDHNFTGGRPLLFETMVFGGPLDQECDRYSTWAEAEVGHAAMVKKCKQREKV